MIEVGRLCIKTTGREKGKKAIVVDTTDANFVIIDGDVKRRRCNITHLDFLPEKIDIAKGASTSEIKGLFKEKGFLTEKKAGITNKKERKGGEKPKKIRPRAKASEEKPKGKAKKKTMSKEEEDKAVEDALAKV